MNSAKIVETKITRRKLGKRITCNDHDHTGCNARVRDGRLVTDAMNQALATAPKHGLIPPI
jgi:hypothetical protein